MKSLYLYKIDENYSKYMYEENSKLMKAFDNKKKRPFIRNYIRNE